jgi:hypothetical protein
MQELNPYQFIGNMSARLAEYCVRVSTIAERQVWVWRNAEEDIGCRMLFGSYRREAAVRPFARVARMELPQVR